MSYADFTLERACLDFGLTLAEGEDLFPEAPEVDVAPALRTMLDEYIPLATSIHTEKARSEFIVAPVLAEIRRLMGHRVSLFSGIAFDVDRERGLVGFCDFLMARSPIQLVLQAPILSVVEAKNDNIKGGLGQCIAEMVASRIFNERDGLATAAVFGAVTTGSLWRFLQLTGPSVRVDRHEYHIDQLGKILGILLRCVATDG